MKKYNQEQTAHWYLFEGIIDFFLVFLGESVAIDVNDLFEHWNNVPQSSEHVL